MLNKKEIIFQAVIDLLKSNISLNSIKISDIAEFANIGKGTVYEYFKSKDEIISETIIYIMDENTNLICNRINFEQGFKITLQNHIRTLSEIILENSKFHSLMFSGDFGELFNQNIDSKIMKKIMEIKNRYFQLLKSILNKGVEENLFETVTDHFIINAIGNTIFTSIMYYIHEMNSNIEYDKIYDLLLKIIR